MYEYLKRFVWKDDKAEDLESGTFFKPAVIGAFCRCAVA